MVRIALSFLAAAAASFALAGPASAAPQVGIQTHSLDSDVSVAEFDRELDALKRAKARLVRVNLGWSSLETMGEGEWSGWYVDKIDTFVEHARRRNIGVVATLLGTPCWASSAPESERQGCRGDWWERDVTAYPPSDPAHIRGVSAFVAKRWGGRLAALEIWNEPNEADRRFLRADDPAAAYVPMLRNAYSAAKAAAPGLTVLGGSIAGSDTEFLDRMYALGAKGSFDSLSFHTYNGKRDPNVAEREERYRKYDFLTGPPALHAALAAHGDGAKGLWLTEFGFSTCTGDSDCVSPKKQAAYIVDSVHILKRWSFLRAGVLYELRDSGGDGRSREHRYGLLGSNFRSKPAFRALARLGRR